VAIRVSISERETVWWEGPSFGEPGKNDRHPPENKDTKKKKTKASKPTSKNGSVQKKNAAIDLGKNAPDDR